MTDQPGVEAPVTEAGRMLRQRLVVDRWKPWMPVGDGREDWVGDTILAIEREAAASEPLRAALERARYLIVKSQRPLAPLEAVKDDPALAAAPTCNCGTFGNAMTCPIHTQADYEAAAAATAPAPSGLTVEALQRYLRHSVEPDGTPCQMVIGSDQRGVLPVCTCGLEAILARLSPTAAGPDE